MYLFVTVNLLKNYNYTNTFPRLEDTKWYKAKWVSEKCKKETQFPYVHSQETVRIEHVFTSDNIIPNGLRHNTIDYWLLDKESKHYIVLQ